MICKNCKVPMRRMISLMITLPATNRSISKSLIKQKEVNILGANWGASLLFCDKCGAEPELGNPLDHLIDAQLKLHELAEDFPNLFNEVQSIKESLDKITNCVRINGEVK